MEKNETILHEFNNLILTTSTVATCSRDEIESFFRSTQNEVAYSEKLLDRLKKEIAANTSKIDELSEKEQQSKARLLEVATGTDDVLPQSIIEAYEAALRIQVEMTAAREQKIARERTRDELESRLQDLQTKEENTEKLSAQIDELVGNFSRMSEMVDKVKALAQSQNFGFRIIQAQEEERRRVAREIHDGPAQAMANVIFLAEVCEKLLEIDSARAKRELHELRQQVRGCLAETRKIIFDLRPMALDDLGLIPTVKRIADMLKERTGIKVNVKLSGTHNQQMPSHVEVGLFRIIQEALNNIEKHSNASEAQVSIDFQPDSIAAVIEDNGNGFEVVKNCVNSESFGLVGMRERVSLLDGQLEVNSHKGSGTEIAVKIPISAAVSDMKRLA